MQAFQTKTKDYKYKTNININLKPKIIAKHLLANRLLTLKKMREIKFRVFDKKIGKIFKAHDLRFTAEEAIYEVCHDTIRNDGGKHWEFTDFKEVVLMQFTGLKDKNGKEIYEGDILTYNGITSNGNKIIREVNYNAENARFQSGMYPLTQSVELSEIIGNIYENPELTQTTS